MKTKNKLLLINYILLISVSINNANILNAAVNKNKVTPINTSQTKETKATSKAIASELKNDKNEKRILKEAKQESKDYNNAMKEVTKNEQNVNKKEAKVDSLEDKLNTAKSNGASQKTINNINKQIVNAKSDLNKANIKLNNTNNNLKIQKSEAINATNIATNILNNKIDGYSEYNKDIGIDVKMNLDGSITTIQKLSDGTIIELSLNSKESKRILSNSVRSQKSVLEVADGFMDYIITGNESEVLGVGYRNNRVKDAELTEGEINVIKGAKNFKGEHLYTIFPPINTGITNDDIYIGVSGNNGGNGNTSTSIFPPFTPPAPVVTSSTSSQSCSYISSYSPSWSNCNINSNWSNNGNITCSQTNSWQANSSSASRSCTTTYVDGKSSGTTCNGSCPSSAPSPATQTETKTLAMLLSNSSTTTNNAFANNRDTNSIRVTISGNTNQNKPITGLVGTNYANITDIRDTSGLKANRIDNSGNNALNFANVTDSDIQGSGTNFYFSINGIKSFAPVSTSNGSISFKVNGVTMNLSNIKYKFDKLFTSQFNTTNIKIGTTQNIELGVNKLNYSNSTLSSYNISNISDSIKVNPDDRYVIQNKGNENNTYSNPNIDLRLNYSSSNNINSDTSPYLSVNPIITYNIDGIQTKYYISNTKDSATNNLINSANANFDSIKITGTIQSQGKAELTGQNKNFSDLSKATQRAEVRKNAVLLTKNMTSGQVINSVKYVIGDYSISGDNLGFETIIIKDGNLIINGDLNSSGKKLGIIVLKDGYNVDNGYNGKGNVYIDKSVKYINAIIYADGGIISSNLSNPYTSDSDQRTKDLKSQLVIKGSIFTRNTIGGAILGISGKYKLPGGQETSDFNKAMIYDLNYLRSGNLYADISKNGGNSNNVVIIYNSSIQNNPPKGFSSN